MPLSREEQRALEEIERVLAQDPRFVRRIGRRRLRRILAAAILGMACGVALMIIGLVGTDPGHVVLAVTGFAVIVASCSTIVTHTGSRRIRRLPPGRRGW